MYLGDYIAFPALWIDPKPFVVTETIDNRASQNHGSQISVHMLADNLTLMNSQGEGIDNVILSSLNGAVVAKGERISSGQQHVSLTSLHAGMYLLSWHQGNATMSKYVTLAR